jgi:RimJ/RimL family protein N-acetyltransferase
VKQQPSLETNRLLLRPLMAGDDLAVRGLANDPEVASRSVWPLRRLGRKLARRWIAGTRESWAAGAAAEFGIQLKSGGEIIGLAGFDSLDADRACADLSFLVSPQRWGNGYATEAAAAMLWYGFRHLKLNRISACHLVSNKASRRVLAKLGMKREGRLRQFARKGTRFEDVVLVALLREAWLRG